MTDSNICDRCGYKMYARRSGNKLKDGSRSTKWDWRCQHATNANQGCVKSHTMMEEKLLRLIQTALLPERP